MKKQPTTFKSGALPRFLRATGIAGLLPALVLLLSTQSSRAGSATWLANPATGDWSTAANWTAGGPPHGSSDTATFASSNITGVSLSLKTEVNGIVFNAGASAFTITATPTFTLGISGVGITNNSGIRQNFVTDFIAPNSGVIQFFNGATAGSLTAFTNSPHGGQTRFNGTSTAGNGTFTNNGGFAAFVSGGLTTFNDTSTAGNGTFINNAGAVNDSFGGITLFLNSSTAGNGTFTANGAAVIGALAGETRFNGTSTASNATLIANGSLGGADGLIVFNVDSTGGTARVEVFGGLLDIYAHNPPGVTTGSIEGSGFVSLGANNLTVGSNNLSTTFSGVIQDGVGTGGSLGKIGTGTLTLSNASTYTGGTIVSDGVLNVTNTSGSATGTGAVLVKAGTLGGTGIIAGAVTVGTRNGTGAFLAPGTSATLPGTLTIQSKLKLQADATYQFGLNSSNATADETVANGVSINRSAQFSFTDLGSGALTLGTVFTVINNTATTRIAGTFSNLADGSTFTSGSNTYQVSYEGGDGNDLTLTVQ